MKLCEMAQEYRVNVALLELRIKSSFRRRRSVRVSRRCATGSSSARNSYRR